LTKKYKVVINSWLADGGDGYKLFKNITEKYDIGILTREAIYDYLEQAKTYSPAVDGRINIIE